MGRHLLLAASLLGASCYALLIGAPPAQTLSVVLPPDAQSPRPTKAPVIPLAIAQELLKRDVDKRDSSLTFNFAPDNTCGYVNGNQTSSYTCPTGANCVFIPATGFTPGAMGCCNLSQTRCEFHFTCFDSRQLAAGVCNNKCMSDTYTLKCNAGSATFCNTIAVNGIVTDFFCNPSNFSTVLTASTTFIGETDSRTLTTLVVDSAGLLGSGVTLSATASPTSSPAPAPSGGGGGAPVGAIVGGVVGGVAVIAILVLGLLFIMRRKKNTEGEKPAAVATNNDAIPPAPASDQTPSTAYPSTYGASPKPYGDYYSPEQQHTAADYIHPQHSGRPISEMTQQDARYNRASLMSGGVPSPGSTMQTFPQNSQHVSMQSFAGHQQHLGDIQEADASASGGIVADARHHRGELHELG